MNTINWYKQYSLQAEAQIIPKIGTGILAAIVLLLMGSTVQNAVQNAKVSKEEIKEALQNPAILEKAQQIVQEQTEKEPIEKEPIEKEQTEEEQIAEEHLNNNTLKQIAEVVILLENAPQRSIGDAQDTGIMQMLPNTWQEVNNLYFSNQFPYEKYKFNLNMQKVFGYKYLKHLKSQLQKYKNQWQAPEEFLILAAYNGGFSRIKEVGFNAKALKREYPPIYDYASRGSNLLGIN